MVTLIIGDDVVGDDVHVTAMMMIIIMTMMMMMTYDHDGGIGTDDNLMTIIGIIIMQLML